MSAFSSCFLLFFCFPLNVSFGLLQYYKNLGKKVGLFTSDQSMLLDPRTRATVAIYSRDQAAFFREFSASLIKLSEIGILAGANGEVRTNCRLPRRLSQ